MKIDGVHYRSIELNDDGWSLRIFDQRQLPWKLAPVTLASIDDAATAIIEMWTRGGPMIGATAAYGLCMALRQDPSDKTLSSAYHQLLATRPTAINLRWALDKIVDAARPHQGAARITAAYICAANICDEDVKINRAIGKHGLKLIRSLANKKSTGPVNILTHCNAGWLATVDYGTALSPIYLAHDNGIELHVWVDETRPRNQGSAITAYELAQHGVPHTVIVDNAGGLLMQQKKVDMCIVGTDRVTLNGDVCNKIGTYLKALAAKDNDVPFYVALPYTTIDNTLQSGDQVPLEERDPLEVSNITGRTAEGKIINVALTTSPVANYAFDITPSRLVTGYITEKGLLNNLSEWPEAVSA